MSNVITNLKVRFGADTSKFKKGMNEGDKAMKDFTGQGKSAFASFAKVFGVDISAMSNQAGAFTSGLGAMKAGFKSTAAGSGILTKAMKILKVAMISTGIGALVVALGSLIAYFTNTKRGGDKVSQTMAAIGAIMSVITDRASAVGEWLIKAFSEPKETIAALWEFIKSQFVNRIAAIPKLIQSAWNIVKGIFTGGAKDAAKEFGKSYIQLLSGLDETQQKKVGKAIGGLANEIGVEAQAAYNLKKRLNELEDAEIKLIEVNSLRAKNIEELRNKSKELRYKDIEGSRKALQQAMQIEQDKLNDELRIAKERASIIEQQKALGENMREDDRELAEAKAKVNEIEKVSLAYRRRMITEMQTLNREHDTYNANLIKEANLRGAEMPEGKMKPSSLGAFSIDTSTLKPTMEKSLGDLEGYAGEVRAIFTDLGATINGALEGVVTGFAETFGSLLAGTGSLAGFGQIVLGSLADLAITVGKVAISTGIAVAGIKTALKSLNPVVAIAAGAALVTLGTVVKSSLSSAASGGGSTFGGSTGNYTFDTRGNSSTRSTSSASLQPAPVQVEVSGVFKQYGRDLVAVVNKEGQRTNITSGR